MQLNLYLAQYNHFLYTHFPIQYRYFSHHPFVVNGLLFGLIALVIFILAKPKKRFSNSIADLASISSGDLCGTLFDLSQALIEKGEVNEAKEILSQIISMGNLDQKKQARLKLKSLS